MVVLVVVVAAPEFEELEGPELAELEDPELLVEEALFEEDILVV